MINEVEIRIKAGAGGSGAVSFRHEKFIPFGGPDGGDGGRGGDIYIMVKGTVNALYQFRYKRCFRAGNGGNGTEKDRHGKNGDDILIKVPPGTVVYRKEGENKIFVADLMQEGQSLLVARGGVGGYGNAHFASPINRAPRIANKGQPGEECCLLLQLKLIADVGIIGYPNVGKSTLLASCSAARAEIADYPFTTREPVLGVVEVGWKSFIIAEIPGLIEGAHSGRGLGHEFLRHVERTRLLIHFLDGTSPSPVDDFSKVRGELDLYDSALLEKPQMVVVNKLDIPQVRARLLCLGEEFSVFNLPVLFISAKTGEGVPLLIAKVVEMLDEMVEPREAPQMVFRPKPKYSEPIVSKENGIFVVCLPSLERLVACTDLNDAEGRRYLRKQFDKLKVTKALRRAGMKSGDRLRVGETELEWD